MNSSNIIIEIATSDYTTTKLAVDGGADRIELCANLAEGGITPSIGTLQKCRNSFDIAMYPIIRPRGGDFLFSQEEFEIMQYDIIICRQLGYNGIVIGILKADGTIDLERTARLISIAYPLEVTFHRAFDRCKDPFIALEQLIEIGCQRILTSGQKPTAIQGVDLITELQKQADDRIIIMPGSGINKENIKQLAFQTGCTEFHASLRTKVKSQMQFVHPSFTDCEDSYLNNTNTFNDIKEMKTMAQP